jgi:hypothetical protein
MVSKGSPYRGLKPNLRSRPRFLGLPSLFRRRSIAVQKRQAVATHAVSNNGSGVGLRACSRAGAVGSGRRRTRRRAGVLLLGRYGGFGELRFWPLAAGARPAQTSGGARRSLAEVRDKNRPIGLFLFWRLIRQKLAKYRTSQPNSL